MAVEELKAVAFARLSPEQVAALEECGAASVERYAGGHRLTEAGSRSYRFYVVKSGAIEILDESDDPPRTITVHEPGQFTGEVGMLTGRAAIVTSVTREDSEVLAIPVESLRQVINECTGIGDTILQAFIARRQLLREPGVFPGVRVIGSRYSKDTLRIRDFLARNRVFFTFIDVESDEDVAALLERFGLTEKDTPVVACGRDISKVRKNPSNAELADALGIQQPLEHAVYDLAIVGGGPGGLAAAVYGASEGLRTVVLERTAPGGQAGTSMRIENYLGFPTGISGADLADRAVLQANKFGATLSIPSPVVGLTFDSAYPVLRLEDGDTVNAKCLLIVTGADYRKLDVEGCERFEGSGVYYAATPNEAAVCSGAEVVIVGGGNSAGQAAVFLAGSAKTVHLVCRSDSLRTNMSTYLAARIESSQNIEVHLHTVVRKMLGDRRLTDVEIFDRKNGVARTISTPALFSFIGATPRTDWLPPEIERDEKNFVRTGPDLVGTSRWKAARAPFLLETTQPGVFAAGDVRAGSVKRVASAVGEGAMAVQFVHEYLKAM